MICDFCSSTYVCACYQTNAPILQPEFGVSFDDKWSACAVCAEIIDRETPGRQRALLDRAVATQSPEAEFPRDVMEAFLTPVYAEFFRRLVRKSHTSEADAAREPAPPILIEFAWPLDVGAGAA